VWKEVVSREGGFSVLSVVLGPGHEHAAAENVLRRNPRAMPNRRMLELADQILGGDSCLLLTDVMRGSKAE